MARLACLSNGRLFVAYDSHGTIRELTWPNVGVPNHLLGHWIRCGLWIDHHLSWLDGGGWGLHVTWIESGRGVSLRYESHHLGATVLIQDVLDSQLDRVIRKIRVTNHRDSERVIQFVSTHDLRISETDVSDTAMHDPDLNGVLHYKERVAFGSCFFGTNCDQYACGMKGYGGMEGTWRDAEDGHLSNKPIEQGTVDSTMSTTLDLPAHGSVEFEVRFGFAPHVNDLRELLCGANDSVAEEISPSLSLKEVSLHVVKAHFTRSELGAGLTAACDSSIMTSNRANYASVWMRDHCLTALTMLHCGERELAEQAFRFCQSVAEINGVVTHDGGRFRQKYTPAGNLGPSWHPKEFEGQRVFPWQEDETALVVTLGMTLGEQNREAVRPYVNALLEEIDPSGLPTPSWDLWEERRGVHFWTVATVIEALEIFAEPTTIAAVSRMKEAARAAFFGDQLQRTVGDATADSSVLAALLLPPFADWRAELERATSWIIEKLDHQPLGGVGRYEGDYYFRETYETSGNAWVISTIWLAQALLRLGRTNEAKVFTDWVEQKAQATSTLVLAEQYSSNTGEPRSVMPLAWSHAAYLDLLNESNYV